MSYKVGSPYLLVACLGMHSWKIPIVNKNDISSIIINVKFYKVVYVHS
jgi:hypothetical protein